MNIMVDDSQLARQKTMGQPLTFIGGLFDAEDAKRVSTVDALLNSIRVGVYEGFISGLTIAEVLEAPAKIHETLQARIAETGFQVLEETTGL